MPVIVDSIVNLPLFLIILGAGAVVSAVIAGPLARWLGEPWLVVFGLGVSLALVFAATLSPAPGSVSGPCLREIARPLGPRGLLLMLDSDRAWNTWLTVPFGFFAGYLAVRRWWVLVLAFLVPLFVEGVQRVLPILGRRCQFQDLIDNTWGLIIGALAGIIVGWFVPWALRSSRY